MQKPYKSLQVFKNPYLEKLTHVHPITPLIVWTPIIAYLFWRSFIVDELSPFTIGSMGALGFGVWTIVEYLLHRYVFHYEGEGPITQRLHFLIHGLHHEDPVDPTRLVMPPAASLIIGFGLYSIFRPMVGPVLIDPFFAFFSIGYLCYDYIHYAVHHFTPRTRLGKFLKQSHMIHHFVSPNARWGVSSPIWDYVFGTMEDVKSKERAV